MKPKKPIRRPGHAKKPQQSVDRPLANPVPATAPAPEPKPVEGSFWGNLLSVKLVLGSLGLTAAGVFAYFTPFIDPLKTAVLHYMYTEKAVITLSCDPCTISKGEATRISIAIAPSPSVDIAEGVLKLDFNERELTLSDETPSSFETSVISSKRLLSKSFVLYPTEAVTSQIRSAATVMLETKFGVHKSEPIQIFIEPSVGDARGPYIEPGGKHRVVLTGEWRLELGGSLGGMRITQDEKDDISGVYWLNEPTGRIEAKVDGYKDGTSFKVFFMRPKKQSRWRVEANFYTNAVDKGFIEIRGCAFSLRPDSTVVTDSASPMTSCTARNYVGWRGDGGATFWASAKLR